MTDLESKQQRSSTLSYNGVDEMTYVYEGCITLQEGLGMEAGDELLVDAPSSEFGHEHLCDAICAAFGLRSEGDSAKVRITVEAVESDSRTSNICAGHRRALQELTRSGLDRQDDAVRLLEQVADVRAKTNLDGFVVLTLAGAHGAGFQICVVVAPNGLIGWALR